MFSFNKTRKESPLTQENLSTPDGWRRAEYIQDVDASSYILFQQWGSGAVVYTKMFVEEVDAKSMTLKGHLADNGKPKSVNFMRTPVFVPEEL